MKEIYKNSKLVFSVVDEKEGFVNLKLFCEAVLIVGIAPNNKLLVIKQKRTGSSVANYEFPSGGVKEGESCLEAAERELNEETGYRGKLTFVSLVQPLSGLVDLNVHVFMAVDLVKVENKLPSELYEKIECEFLGVEQIKEMMLNTEKETDGYLAIGLAYYFLFISKSFSRNTELGLL